MFYVIVPLLAAIVVGVVEYVSKQLKLRHKAYFEKLVSFSAGVSSTYILLELFPLFAESALAINRLLFAALLLGFISHHIIEKEIYQHNSRHDLVKKLSLEENVFYFIYHVMIGFLLLTFMQIRFVEGVFFFVSIIAYTVVSNLPAQPHRSKKRMILLSSSTFVGALIASFVWQTIPLWLEFTLVGLVTGVLLFTVTRHHIPYGRKGKVSYFAAGFIIYSFLILAKWFLF